MPNDNITAQVNETVISAEVANPIISGDVGGVTVYCAVTVPSNTVTQVGLQGPPGIQGVQGPAGIPEQSTLLNGEGVTIPPGTVVYPSSPGTVKKAIATSISTSTILGIVTSSTTSNVIIRTGGIVTLTTGQWDSVFGTTGGLSAGAYYFLSNSIAGEGTSTPVDVTGSILACIGVGVSPDSLYLIPTSIVVL